MDERSGESCEDLIAEYGIEHVYCGYKDPTQDHDDSIETDNPKLRELCKKLSDTFLKEVSDKTLQSYLSRADRQVSNRMDRMAQARERLNKGYEIYHADRPAGGSQIVDRFEADTPALAQKYYERFIRDYVSDVDFDLRLRRATGIIEEARMPAEVEDFLYDLTPGDAGVDEIGPYRIHYEGFTDDCQSSADYCENPEAVYNQVFADHIAREGGRKPIEQNFTGDEDYPILYSVFQIPNQVKETFNQPYPMTWEQGEESSDALVRLPDGTNLSIMFSMDYGAYGDEEWVVEFWRNNSQDVTGEGDAQRIFATVLAAIQKFIQKRHPERIRFSASKEDNDSNNNQSRSNLYTRLVQRYANSWGYSVEVSDHAGSTVYELFNDLNEVTMVPSVAKSKREHLDVMPNDGKPIPKGQESEYLGDLVAKIGNGFQLWSWTDRGTVTYYVFDTRTRTSQLGTTGRPYKTNRDSFVVQGVYSGPKNSYRAADLYAFLILNQGLTLVSDNKQSEGGYRVWQELEKRYKNITVHGFDTKTNKPVNVTTQDEPDTHVARSDVKKAGPQMKRELGSISRDLRFVASKK
jgi:hypothetical protein